jgi:hypothetical protein
MIIAIIALVVAIASAGFSLWAAVSNHRMAEATDRLARADEERRKDERAAQHRAEVAGRRADLRVCWQSGRLTVRNHGPANARRVGVEPVGVYGRGKLPQLLEPTVQPVDLSRDEGTHLLLPASKDVAADIECQLVWEDDEGLHIERRRVRRS